MFTVAVIFEQNTIISEHHIWRYLMIETLQINKAIENNNDKELSGKKFGHPSFRLKH